MKEVWLFRHSVKTGPGNVDLSPEGIELAKSVGATYLKNKVFDRYFVSPLKRTSETMDAFLVGAGTGPSSTYEIFPPYEAGATEKGMSLWSGVCHEAEKTGKDMMHAAMHGDREVAISIAREAAEQFKTWFDGLDDGSCAVVVNHSPLLELMVFGLSDKEHTQLGYCEGFAICGENSSSLSIEEIRR